MIMPKFITHEAVQINQEIHDIRKQNKKIDWISR